LIQRGLIGLAGQNVIREILEPGLAQWLMRQVEGLNGGQPGQEVRRKSAKRRLGNACFKAFA
jgi:hypothetical protein